MKTLEKILIAFILLLLVTPAIQKETSLFKIRELDGDFRLAEKPIISWAGWYSGDFQASFDRYIEDHIGFRNFLVRFTNQVDFSLFRKANAEGVVIGKSDQLYEFDYIRAYMGGDFVGEKIIDRKIRRLKFLQEHLKLEKNIDLILVFEPSKTAFYPEYIPDHYYVEKKENTNLRTYLNKAEQYGIKHINYNSYYNSIKETKEYPLYPRYGIHWSEYGMSFVADSLIRYIETCREIKLANAKIDSINVENTAFGSDYDIGRALNLLWKLPETDSLAYPVYRFDSVAGQSNPNVLVIADSYYWNIFNTRIPQNLFENEAFWYFNKQVYPEYYTKKTHVSDLNLKEEIEKQDVIFIMVTERFMYKFDWSFIDKLYPLYAPMSEYNKIPLYASGVFGYDLWFNQELNNAKARGLEFEEWLDVLAEYLYKEDNFEQYLVYKGPEHYKEQIRENSKWLSSIKLRADSLGVSLAQALNEESVGLFSSKYPEAFNTYSAIQENKRYIEQDSILSLVTKNLAERYYYTFEEMLQIEAEKRLVKSSILD